MEKFPEIRTVGNASPKVKEQIKKEYEELFYLSETKEKSEKELAIINFVNKETNELMQEVGFIPYNIPENNYIFLESNIYKEIKEDKNPAAALVDSQKIIFNKEVYSNNPILFGVAAMHETMHLKGHISVEINEKNGNIKDTIYRDGFSVVSAQKHRKLDEYNNGFHQHFVGLEDAIVSTVEKKAFSKIIELPILYKEKEWLTSLEATILKEQDAEKYNIPEDEIMWIKKKEGGLIETSFFSYYAQRQVLNYVCAEIQKEFPDQYQTSDDVFKEFLKAQFTGQLLSTARLIEKTFGKGSFRTLGDMTADKEKTLMILEKLTTARLKQTEDKKIKSLNLFA